MVEFRRGNGFRYGIRSFLDYLTKPANNCQRWTVRRMMAPL